LSSIAQEILLDVAIYVFSLQLCSRSVSGRFASIDSGPSGRVATGSASVRWTTTRNGNNFGLFGMNRETSFAEWIKKA